MRLNFERVVRFVVVAEEMSFTKAALRLRVDQPWLSRQVQQLEDQLGFQLFERAGRKISLTQKGAVLLEKARQLADSAEEVNVLAGRLARERHEQLMLGCLKSTYWLPIRKRLVALFQERHPRTALTVTSGPSPLLFSQLERQEIDLALVTPVDEMSQFDYVRLYWGHPGILIPREHSLAQRETVRMSDLAGCKLAVTANPWNQRSFKRLYGPFFDAGMVERPVSEGTLAVRHYAAGERLFMLVFRSPIEAASEDMIYRDVIDTTAEVEFGLARAKDCDLLPVRKMWSLANQMARDAESGREGERTDRELASDA